MAKKPESGGSKGSVPAPASKPASKPGGPPGDGGTGIWTDEFGRLCIGNECFYAALDDQRNEVRVVIDEDGPCGGASADEVKDVVKVLRGFAGKDAQTLYTTKARGSRKESPNA